MGFGKRLKEILKNKGITIKELSEMTGISLNTLYSITKRDTSMPERTIIDKITNALHIDESELITLEIVSGELRKELINLKHQETELRENLCKFSEMLGIEALMQLMELALQLGKNPENLSIFYNNPEFKEPVT